MKNIYKPNKGKDFYRDSLEYFEYDADMFALYEKRERVHEVYEVYEVEDEEIAHIVSEKLRKNIH